MFTNLLLADEINRASPRTQSALLEAMQERAVTAGGKQHTLPQPFMVFATQNPFESEGTFPLPEAQLDRFMFMVMVNYPKREEELEVLKRTTGVPAGKVKKVIYARRIMECRTSCEECPSAIAWARFTIDLVRATRPDEPGASDFVRHSLSSRPGPRAGQNMILAGKARARCAAGCMSRWKTSKRSLPGAAASDHSEFQCGGRGNHR